MFRIRPDGRSKHLMTVRPDSLPQISVEAEESANLGDTTVGYPGHSLSSQRRR